MHQLSCIGYCCGCESVREAVEKITAKLDLLTATLYCIHSTFIDTLLMSDSLDACSHTSLTALTGTSNAVLGSRCHRPKKKKKLDSLLSKGPNRTFIILRLQSGP